jgi:predicted ester cyclase
MAEDANKAAIRNFYAAIDRAQGMAPIDDFAGPTYTAHFPGAPAMPREAMKGFANAFFAACPGLTHSVEQLVSEGDAIAARLTIRGTHTQPFVTPTGTIPPAGRSFELSALNLYRFSEGKVVEHWAAFDMLNFLQQIGAMP